MGYYFDLLMTILKWTSALTAGGLVALSAGIYAFQSSLIYAASIPTGSRSVVDTPEKYGMSEYEDITVETSDGERLHCYLISQTRDTAAGSPTMLIFHANAGNMGHRLPIAKCFHHQMKMNVFMLSYRGYGKSSGTASEKGMKIDSQTALQYILDHKVLGRTRLFAYGQSIGGAVAIDLVARNQGRFAGLIIENTFLSIKSLIPTVLPIASPIARFCHQLWSSEEVIDTIETPMLFLSGLKDELVPPSQMAALYDLAKGTKDKTWRTFPNGTHNDTVAQPGYMLHILEFVKRLMGQT